MLIQSFLKYVNRKFKVHDTLQLCNKCKYFVNNCVSAPNESTISEPISGNNPFEEGTPPSG